MSAGGGSSCSGRRQQRAPCCALPWLLLACGSDGGAPPAPEPPATPVQIAQASDWLLADAARDPFVQFEPGRVRCNQAAIQPEGTWIEVSTLDCNYATLSFTFPSAARAGSTLRSEVAWSTLAAIDPAVATLAFALGERQLWTHEVAIPGAANLVSVELLLPDAMRAGDVLYFHVRNHGYNSWQLAPLVLAEAP